MTIWANEYLHRIALEAEETIARETKCLIDRISIPTEIHTGEFQLPEYVLNVRKVYWKGRRLDPRPNLNWLDIGYEIQVWKDDVFNSNAFNRLAFHTGGYEIESMQGSNLKSGNPTEYYYAGFGENIIRISPSADEKLEKYESDVWQFDAIKNAFVIEFYRTANGEDWKIPHYFRRRTIKSYVLWKAFAIEGPGQNLKASQYHFGRFQLYLAKAKKITENIYRALPKIAPSEGYFAEESELGRYYNFNGDYGYQGPRNVPRPVLPPNYGIPLEE